MKRFIILLTMVFTLGFAGISQAVTVCEMPDGSKIINYRASVVDAENHLQVIYCQNEIDAINIYATMLDSIGRVVLYGFGEGALNEQGQKDVDFYISEDKLIWVWVGTYTLIEMNGIFYLQEK